jgi:hypothetical protein
MKRRKTGLFIRTNHQKMTKIKSKQEKVGKGFPLLLCVKSINSERERKKERKKEKKQQQITSRKLKFYVLYL